MLKLLMLRHPFSETQTHPGGVTMLNSWPPPTLGAAVFYSTFALKCLWTETWKRTSPSRWHLMSASDVRNRSRPHCWKEKHTGLGVRHNHCELSKACRVCTPILLYFMTCVYFHDWASPVCPINLQSSRLWHHEGTFSPYLPVQLSPLLWWWQWDTVRLASSSVTFHSAREYLHKTRAAGRKKKKYTTQSHTTHIQTSIECLCQRIPPAGKRREMTGKICTITVGYWWMAAESYC